MPPPALIIQPGELIITAFQQNLTIAITIYYKL